MLRLLVNRVFVKLEGVDCVVDFYSSGKSIMMCKHGSIEGKGSYPEFCKKLRAEKIPHRKDTLIPVMVPKSFLKNN